MLCQNPVRHTINVPSSHHTAVVIILVGVVVNTNVWPPNSSITKHCTDLFFLIFYHTYPFFLFYALFLLLPSYLLYIKPLTLKHTPLGCCPYVCLSLSHWSLLEHHRTPRRGRKAQPWSLTWVTLWRGAQHSQHMFFCVFVSGLHVPVSSK